MRCEVEQFQQDATGNMRILIPAKCTKAIESVPRFDDVPCSHWAYEAVTAIAATNISGGCGDNKFCPDSKVTRAELSVMLYRALHLPQFVHNCSSSKETLE